MAYEEKEAAKADESKSDDDKILDDAREYLKQCIDEEDPERAKMQDDLRFCCLDQWPRDIRAEREDVNQEGGPRPCLTIDKINQYIVQILNDIRQGKPGINVRPQDDAADVQTAKVIKGLVRNIEDQSNADIPYYVAAESATRIGLGYFRVTTEYVSEDSFDQELFIRPIPNTFSVYLGKHVMPDGSDAERGFVVESMPIARFKEEYPKKKFQAADFDGLDKALLGYWLTDETITVVEEFCIERTLQELYFLADGTTISAEDYAKWPEDVAGPKPEIQDKRHALKKQLKWRKLTGVEVLEKRDLPGKYIPIVEVVGREAWVDSRRILWGLVRPAKDSLRMYNYFASTITERMGLAPKVPYVGAKGQFAGLEDRWKQANRKSYAYLEYEPIDVNGNVLPPPQRTGPTPLEAALLQQMQVIEHDVQTSLGMFKAATGESESQQSGRAILALQRESDTGTYHFGANLGMSIRHAGRILVDLIPHYYDTKRIVRILGEDGEVQAVQLDPDQEQSHRQIQTPEGIKSIYNPGVGKFDVSITVGPSYNTKRMEAAATFVELSKGAADPGSAAVLRYLTVKNSDFEGSDQAAKALKVLMPPQAIEALSDNQQMPPQALAQIAQLKQAVQILQAEKQELESGAKVEMAKIAANSQAAQAEQALQKQKQDAELQLQREKANAEIELKRAVAMAELELERLKAGLAADGEVDAAIAQVKAMVAIHETKMQGVIDQDAAAREGAAEGEAQRSSEQSMAEMRAMHQQLLEKIGEIVERIADKKNDNKNIDVIRRDGQIVGARVTAGA